MGATGAAAPLHRGNRERRAEAHADDVHGLGAGAGDELFGGADHVVAPGVDVVSSSAPAESPTPE